MFKKASILKKRMVLKISGKDNGTFLNNILTNDVNKLNNKSTNLTALLNPQGKILYDIFIFKNKIDENHDEYYLECSTNQMDDLIKKLKLYSLRLNVNFEPKNLTILVSNFLLDTNISLRDVRFSKDQIYRNYLLENQIKCYDINNVICSEDWYDNLRYQNCFPEGNIEIPTNELYPFEIKIFYDKGISFDKGCFIGQEVVARVKYKGKPKKRLMCVKINSDKIIKNGILYDNNKKVVGALIYNSKVKDTIFGYCIFRLQAMQKNTEYFCENTLISLI